VHITPPPLCVHLGPKMHISARASQGAYALGPSFASASSCVGVGVLGAAAALMGVLGAVTSVGAAAGVGAAAAAAASATALRALLAMGIGKEA
jgi:hypothetical protein